MRATTARDTGSALGSPMERRILAVIVLYKTTAEESASYRSLLRSADAMLSGVLNLAVILHDNTPGAVAPEYLPPQVKFVVDESNSGLAGAYNHALAAALEGGYDWLLTLDQDTDLPVDFLRLLAKITAELEGRPDVIAVVPQIQASGRIVSPNYFAAGAWPRWFPPGYSGIPTEPVYGFNSGSLIRTSALCQIGGYSPWFWLDNSDMSLYRQLSQFGKRVYVAGELKVDHDFSMLNMQERISPERYRTILLAEFGFWDLEMNALAGLERTARLAGRLFKHWQRGDSRELRRLTLEALGLRLFRSRRHRIERWRRATREKLGGVLEGWVRPGRPMISVCMAAYNGERYIEAQLRSIWPQLGPKDEIVIVDDASRDGTVNCVRRIQGELREIAGTPKMLLVEHRVNHGVIRTFEDAIRSASGDILFLCDDDDLWAPDKVVKVMDRFAAEPDTRLVSTGMILIDEFDQPILGSDFLKHRRFTTNLAANLIHNQFQGSAMAFRSTLIRDLLPFPQSRLFLHDAWIGARNTLAGGGTAYIDEPLLLYRRHSGNYSGRLSRWKQIKLRLQLITTHFGRSLLRTLRY